MSQKLEMPRNQLIDETIHNVGRLYRIAVPFFLDLEAQASIAASEQGYAPIRLQTRNQGKVQAAHYQHETKYRFASTPDIGSLGIHSFPQYWEADSFWGLNYQEVFEKLPHASLTMITKLIGPNEGPYNQVVRQSAITLRPQSLIT